MLRAVRTKPAMRKAIVAIVVCAVAGAVSLTALAGGARTTKPFADKTVVVVTFGDNTPWGAEANRLTKKGLEDAGMKILAFLPDPDDAAIQAQHMNQAIALKPDLILVAPDDANAIVPSLQRAHNAGIGIIVFNSPASAAADSIVASTVMANNSLLGKYAGENMVAGLKAAGYKKANIIHITGTASMTIVQQRIAAFNKVLKAYPQYKVVSVQDANWDPGKSNQLAAQLFAQYKSKGGIQGAYGTADYMALGIASAAKQAGLKVGTKPGNVVVVGSNCTGPGVKSVIAGELAGDATQVPAEQANLTVDAAKKFFAGAKLPKLILFTPVKITRANAKQHLKACSY